MSSFFHEDEVYDPFTSPSPGWISLFSIQIYRIPRDYSTDEAFSLVVETVCYLSLHPWAHTTREGAASVTLRCSSLELQCHYSKHLQTDAVARLALCGSLELETQKSTAVIFFSFQDILVGGARRILGGTIKMELRSLM